MKPASIEPRLARSSSCIWMSLIWRVKSAGLMPSMRAAKSESW
ncbi:hypothetical protein [Mycobacterium heckeshornense]